MIFAVKLGPVQVGNDSKNVYVGFTEDQMLPPVLSQNDEEGLWGLLAYGPSEPRLCDASLAEAGAALGFEVMPTPEEFFEPLASLALTTALGTSVAASMNGDILVEFAMAAEAFDATMLWEFWHSDQAIEVSLVGDVTGDFEASIMGSGGEQYGLSLYADRGAIKRTSDLVAAGLEREARRIDFLSMSFAPEPEFALRALEDAFDLDEVPVPMKIHDGARVPATELDLLALAAVLRATSELTPRKFTGAAMVRAGGMAIVATVRAPDSERDPRDLAE